MVSELISWCFRFFFFEEVLRIKESRDI